MNAIGPDQGAAAQRTAIGEMSYDTLVILLKTVACLAQREGVSPQRRAQSGLEIRAMQRQSAGAKTRKEFFRGKGGESGPLPGIYIAALDGRRGVDQLLQAQLAQRLDGVRPQ